MAVLSSAIVSASGFSWCGEYRCRFYFNCVVRGNWWFSVVFGLGFFKFLVIGLGDSSGWRRAVSRMAAPGGLVLIHR